MSRMMKRTMTLILAIVVTLGALPQGRADVHADEAADEIVAETPGSVNDYREDEDVYESDKFDLLCKNSPYTAFEEEYDNILYYLYSKATGVITLKSTANIPITFGASYGEIEYNSWDQRLSTAKAALNSGVSTTVAAGETKQLQFDKEKKDFTVVASINTDSTDIDDWIADSFPSGDSESDFDGVLEDNGSTRATYGVYNPDPNGDYITISNYDPFDDITIYALDDSKGIDTEDSIPEQLESRLQNGKAVRATVSRCTIEGTPSVIQIKDLPADANSDGKIELWSVYGGGKQSDRYSWRSNSFERKQKEYKRFTFRYNANDGSDRTKDVEGYAGYHNTIQECMFERGGYSFLYWSSYANGDNPVYVPGDTEFIDESEAGKTVNLYAIWQKAGNYSVKFDSNGGSGNMADQSITVGAETALNKCTFTKDGYSFVGWNKEENKNSKIPKYKDEAEVTDLASADQSVTLYAVWAKNGTYTIKFDPNGGTGTMADQIITEINNGVELNMGTFEMEGYDFMGWNTDKNAADTLFSDEETIYIHAHTDPDTPLVLYAIWGLNSDTYSVNFYPNGAAGERYSQKMPVDDSRKLRKNAFTYKGYKFLGWSENENATAAEYTDEQEVLLTNEKSAVVNLYAVWEKVGTYTVKFDKNGGSGTMGDQTVTVGEKEKLDKNSFTREDHTFAGWALSEGGAVNLTDEAEVTDLAQKDGTVTLYAVWSEIAKNYTISYNANGGSGTMESQIMTRGVSQKLKKNAFTKEGFEFRGWSLSAGEVVKYNDEAEVTDLAGRGETVILYAIWEAGEGSKNPNDQNDQDGKNDPGKPDTIPAASISLSIADASVTLKKGGSLTLTAKVLPENATNKEVIWSIDNSAVATVSDGIVTAKDTGKTTLTATTKDGGLTASCEILVVSDELPADIADSIKPDKPYSDDADKPVETVPHPPAPVKISKDVSIPLTYDTAAVIYSGGKVDPEKQLGAMVDLSPLAAGLAIKDTTKTINDLVTVEWVVSGKDKGGRYFYPKLKITKTAKKTSVLTRKNRKSLNKLISNANKAFKKNNARCRYTVYKRSLTDGVLSVKVQMKNDAIKLNKNGKITKVKSIKLKISANDEDTITLKNGKDCKVTLIDAASGLVQVDAKKNSNFTGSVTIYVVK